MPAPADQSAALSEAAGRAVPVCRRRWLGAAAIALATLAAYAPVYRAGYIWDDDDYVYLNPHLPAADGLARIWTTDESPQYYPLVFTTYWLEYRLWGLHPAGYHVVNVLLHIANALLVARLLRRLGVRPAIVIAAAFALHPLHVESVAWITERKNVLSGLFYLLAMDRYLSFESAATGAGRVRAYGLAVSAFALALLAKTIACTLGPVLLLLRWGRGQPVRGRDVLAIVPFLLLGAAGGLLTSWYEHAHVLHGAGGTHWALGPLERCLIAGRAVWFYAGQLLFPYPLLFNYPRWQIATDAAVQWLPLVGAVAVAAIVTAGARWWGRWPAVGAWFYAITLSPALGFVNVAPMRFSFVADHFCYLASVGLLAVVVGGGHTLLRGAGDARLRQWGRVLAGVMLLTLGVRTAQQASVYESAETLWRYTLAHHPDSWLGRINLAVALRNRGALDEAAANAQQVLDRWAQLPEPAAHAHLQLGHVARAQGDLPAAALAYEQALQRHPGLPEALFSLAAVSAQLGDHSTAVALYDRYLAVEPTDARAHANCALSLLALGEPGPAMVRLHLALDRGPALSGARLQLARVLATQGRRDEALQQYHLLMQQHPDSTGLLAEVQRFEAGLGVAPTPDPPGKP